MSLASTAIWMLLLSFVPGIESQGSITYGILTLGGGSWLTVYVIAFIANMIVGVFAYFFVKYLLILLRRIEFIEKVYQWVAGRAQQKIQSIKHFQTYEVLGLAVLISIPGPGSGVYTASIIASLLSMSFKNFMLGCALGLLVANLIIIALVTGGSGLWSLLWN